MTRDENLARTIAFFRQSSDKALLQEVLRELRPRAAAAVRSYQERGSKIPPPHDVVLTQDAATEDEALQTVRGDLDFGALQAISRAVGRRLESLSQAGP